LFLLFRALSFGRAGSSCPLRAAGFAIYSDGWHGSGSRPGPAEIYGLKDPILRLTGTGLEYAAGSKACDHDGSVNDVSLVALAAQDENRVTFLQRTDGRGLLEISFFSTEDLDRIYSILTPNPS